MIYKYYSIKRDLADINEDYTYQALVGKYFWFAKHGFLNDPFDLAGDFLKRFPKFATAVELFNPHYEELIQNFGVCCFSHNPLNKHLWALYAMSYTGFVLGFEDRTENGETIDDLLSSELKAKVIFRNCQYRENYPNFDDFSTKIECNDNQKRTINDILKSKDAKLLDNIFEYYLIIKEKSIWKIEEEKRMILGANYIERIKEERNGYAIPWPVNTLKEIIWGNRMDDKMKDEIRKILPSSVIGKTVKPMHTGRKFELILE